MTTEDQQECAEAHRGLGLMRGDARKRTATLNSELRVAPTDSVTDSVADSFTPEQRAAIEANVLRRVSAPRWWVNRGYMYDDLLDAYRAGRNDLLDHLRAEADRIGEGAR